MVKAAVSWLSEVSWKSWMVMRAGLTGTSAPARASLWAGVPLIFFAEKMGGSWSISPWNCWLRVRRSSRDWVRGWGSVGGGAFGVEGVGGEAEADVAGVVLFGLVEELGEAGVFAEEEREDSGGHGVERAEVADGFFSGGATDDGDDVVRGHAGGLVEYEETVHAATSLVARRSFPGGGRERGTRCGSGAGF